MSREKILIRTSWVSTIGNAILSASKIIVGLFAGSLAVLGDGIDSATDVIISIVMIFTARIMNRPPSKKYVFGYERNLYTNLLSTNFLPTSPYFLYKQIELSYLLSVGENKNFFSVYRGNKQLNAGKRKLAPYLQNVAHLKPV